MLKQSKRFTASSSITDHRNSLSNNWLATPEKVETWKIDETVTDMRIIVKERRSMLWRWRPLISYLNNDGETRDIFSVLDSWNVFFIFKLLSCTWNSTLKKFFFSLSIVRKWFEDIEAVFLFLNINFLYSLDDGAFMIWFF